MTHRMFNRTARWTVTAALALSFISLPGRVAFAAQDAQAPDKRAAEKARQAEARTITGADKAELEKRLAEKIIAEKVTAEKQAARQKADYPGGERSAANIRIDVKITDQATANQPIVKTLSCIVGDREEGYIRTSVDVPVAMPTPPNVAPIYDLREMPLNVDLRARLFDSSHVLVGLSISYKTTFKVDDEAKNRPLRTSDITQKFSLFLENGKPVIVSQSADVATDRKVAIELKATILK